MKKRSVIWVSSIFAVLFTATQISSCRKEDLKITTTEDVNIVGYLEKNIDSFSLFKQILDRTENSAFLNAYGSYTIFAPTNSGVRTWLSSVSAANVSVADLNTLKDLVRFHLLSDTVSTGSFRDGKLATPTMHGQFLITGVAFKDGLSNYSVNRQASIIRSNIKVGNGIIHVIDNMLTPAKLTIAQQMEANPDYSIFVQAMKETGYYNLLNTVEPDTTKRWKTVIAESNRALADSGITSYAALKARYSNTGNPLNNKDSLYLYISFHILDGIMFLGDVIIAPSHLTLQPQEVISAELIGQNVVVNRVQFDTTVVEPGVILDRTTSDNSATNGVWHTATAHFAAKFRKPAAVYWDVATFPEMVKLTAYYKKQSYRFSKQSQEDMPIKDMDWHWTSNSNFIDYFYDRTSTLSVNAVNNDVLTLPLGPPARALWWDLTTPVLIKGRYKVWVCYSSQNAVICNVRVNGELMQRPVNFGEAKPSGSDAELESIGWKQYTVTTTGGRSSGRLVGIVDIKTTEKHQVRFEAVSGTNAAGSRLDMIHFIPVDENQILPRFNTDGTKVF